MAGIAGIALPGRQQDVVPPFVMQISSANGRSRMAGG